MNHKARLTALSAVCLMGFVACTTAPRNFVTGPQGETIAAAPGTPQSQSHTINGAFAVPLAVIVNQNGSPASGVTVTFTAPTAGASGKFADTGTASTTAMTDANGMATAGAFIGNGTAGAYTVTASAQGAPTGVTFSLTNTTGAPAALSAPGVMAQSASINSTYAPLVVNVVDAGKNPVQFAIVVFNAPTSGASGTFADTGTNTTSATTDASGVATSTAFTANSIAGANTVTATVAGVSTPLVFNLTNLAGPPVTITASSGTPQRAAIDTAFSSQLVATVHDVFLNPVSGVAVTFSSPASNQSGTFSNGTTTETDVTDANGMATSTLFSANSTTGLYTVTAAVGGVATPADFSLTNTLPFKTYVFSISGEEFITSGFYALAGAVQIDTSGNVLGGEEDYNDGSGIASSQPLGDSITGGTLKVSASTGQGTLVLNTLNSSLGVAGTETLGVQFVNVKHALINQFDGTATSTGSMDVQTLPATLSGGYAFTLAGVDPNSSPVAFGGVFTISGGTNLQGLLDTNDAGTGTVTTGASLSGTISAPDSFGRGTITSTINYTSLVNTGIPAPVSLNYYVVGPEVFRIIDVDSTSNGSTPDSALGSAFGQGVNATSSSNAALGSSVFGMIGNTLSQFAAAGMFTTNNSAATFSGIADDDELTNGIQLSASVISGTYSIGTNGYGSLTITSGSLGDVSVVSLYMTDPNLNLSDPNNTSSGLGGALVADMDAVLAAGTGVLIPQTDTATAHFTGNYAFQGQAYASLLSSGEFDFLGRGTVASGVLSSEALISDPFFTLSTKATDTGVKFAGTPLADTSNPGHYTMSSTNPTPNPLQVTIKNTITDFDLGIYQVSGGQLFWLNEDSTSVFLGQLQRQTSLKGLPAIRVGGTLRAAPNTDGSRR